MRFLQKNSYLVLTGLIISIGVCFIPIGIISPFAIALIGFFLGIIIVAASDAEDREFLYKLFIGSYLLRIFFAVFLYNLVYIYNGTGLLGDSMPYSENGYTILTLWRQGITDFMQISSTIASTNPAGNLGNYDVWNAMVYSFTEKSPLSVIFINCITMSLAIIFIYNIAKMLYDEKAARFASILTAFWPSVFFWSIQNLKESISIFLVVILFFAILAFQRQFRFHLVFIAILAVILLKEFRGVALLVFVMSLFLSFFVHLWSRKRLDAILILSVITIMILFFVKDVFKMHAAGILKEEIGGSMLEFIHQRRAWKAYGGSAFLSNINLTNPFNLTLYAPIGFFVALFAPFPWQWGSLRQIVSIPEMVFYYFLIFYIFSGSAFLIRNRIRGGAILVSFVFTMVITLALAEGNIGTLFRHRAMILPLMFILAAIGWSEKRKREKCLKGL